ncbi:MAG: HAD-IA family hydrolase, partial [Rhodospirillaceae bacterium]|nr:HAD-IA family hydrolase [Rhodospirillaceae bacterium]
ELTQVFPGAIDVLKTIKSGGVKTAICTNKPYDATMEILEKLDLAVHFDAVIAGDTVPGIKKPDPRHLAAALDAMGAAKETSAMVGDNANDVSAAHALGIPIVLMSHGYTKIPVRELGAEMVIDNFDALDVALKSLGAR